MWQVWWILQAWNCEKVLPDTPRLVHQEGYTSNARKEKHLRVLVALPLSMSLFLVRARRIVALKKLQQKFAECLQVEGWRLRETPARPLGQRNAQRRNPCTHNSFTLSDSCVKAQVTKKDFVLCTPSPPSLVEKLDTWTWTKTLINIQDDKTAHCAPVTSTCVSRLFVHLFLLLLPHNESEKLRLELNWTICLAFVFDCTTWSKPSLFLLVKKRRCVFMRFMS